MVTGQSFLGTTSFSSRDVPLAFCSVTSSSVSSVASSGTVPQEVQSVLGAAAPGKPESLASKKIQYVVDGSVFFANVPDIGMDRFLVSKGESLGTCGVGTCFAVCLIGETRHNTPVLGLCHKSCLIPFSIAFQQVKDEMIYQDDAEEETIESYVVGGQAPSKTLPEGTLADEQEVTSMTDSARIREVLFNTTQTDDEEDSLSIVVTPEKVYVSKKMLFPPEGGDVGISLLDDDDELDQ